MKRLTTLNEYIDVFMRNCLTSTSVKEFQKAILSQKQKVGCSLLYNGVLHEVMRVSLKNGNYYLAYIETDEEYVLCGYHLNNDDIDDEGNFKYNFGNSHNDKAKIHILMNNEIKL